MILVVKHPFHGMLMPESFPFSLTLSNGEEVTVEEGMVTRKVHDSVVSGEYFTPHVIEPAFGIDRIIWHILDHNFIELEKEDDDYTILSLDASVAPCDLTILPLFDKDGMGEMARDILKRVTSVPGVIAQIDTSRSIGRRYARSDEIGIPWAVTVDHQSIKDGTVTIRRRDDQKQIRSDLDSLNKCLVSGSLESLF